MSSKRKIIRHAFKDFLYGKTVEAGRNVFSSRIYPILGEETPAINVWAGNEEAEVYQASPLKYRRVLDIVVELYIRSFDADDQLDDFMASVEKIIDAGDLFTLNGTVSNIWYSDSSVALRGETTKEGAVGTLTYKVEYYTDAGADPENLPDLETIGAKWNDTADDAFTQDEITLPII